MRNPNGYGSVVKLSGNRRKQFAIRITVGFDKNIIKIPIILILNLLLLKMFFKDSMILKKIPDY